MIMHVKKGQCVIEYGRYKVCFNLKWQFHKKDQCVIECGRYEVCFILKWLFQLLFFCKKDTDPQVGFHLLKFEMANEGFKIWNSTCGVVHFVHKVSSVQPCVSSFRHQNSLFTDLAHFFTSGGIVRRRLYVDNGVSVRIWAKSHANLSLPLARYATIRQAR